MRAEMVRLLLAVAAPLVLVIAIEVAFADSGAALLRSGALGGVAILLALLIAVPLERRISGQVRRIADTARRVAGGAAGERARVESIAEIAEIATQFNAMLDAQEKRALALAQESNALGEQRDALGRESEERFRALAALSADGFWEQDENFRYTMLSRAGVLERRGVARNDVIGFAPWELPGVEPLDGGWEAYRAMIEAHLPYRDHRFRMTLPDGATRYATASGEPRFAPDGRFIGYRGVSSDVTERVRAEESIRRLNAELEDRVRQRTEQLEEANRELEAFSYSVSHDLRAPLRHIDGFARRLEKVMKVSPEAALRDLGIIRGAAKRMGELIDDLFALSRTARAPVNVRRVELGVLARELAGQTPPELGAPEIRWRIGKLPAVLADPSLMRIVLQNLISNAVKYSRKRAVAEIEIDALRTPQGETVVYVRDNGVGFDMRYAEKLFGVFQRLHREEDFEGTGVGLATVRRILHRHGGRIWGEAEPGRGATFSFTVAVAEDRA